MTINKAQGQTLRYAGVWLRGEVFTHGQLYVACSRVSDEENLCFAIVQDPLNSQPTAANVVYDQVLLRRG